MTEYGGMRWAYYNEFEPYAAQWLRNLIKAGLIAPGEVDERSILDVHPEELVGFTQCHFFAGIGGWSYALRFAGWGDDRAVWTGSCPCQPFSTAGRGGGEADERHLWPAWFHLIRECRPATVFGEQVASKDGLKWFGLVSSDLEGEGYRVGAADLCAAGVGAPHIRQRLWFVAHAETGGCSRDELQSVRGERPELREPYASGPSPTGLLAHTISPGVGGGDKRGLGEAGREVGEPSDGAGVADELGDGCEDAIGLADANECPNLGGKPRTKLGTISESDERVRSLGHAAVIGGGSGLCDHGQAGQWGVESPDPSAVGELADPGNEGLPSCQRGARQGAGKGEQGAAVEQCGGASFWSSSTWLPCRDGRWRPTESWPEPLDVGLPPELGYVRPEGDAQGYLSPLIGKTFCRVGRLKGYGNSIVPQVAAEFICAIMAASPCPR